MGSEMCIRDRHRSPFTYRNPVNGQEPNIRNAQTPFTYQNRQPVTYERQGRTPFTYQNRQPSTYARQGQNPFTYQNRQPATYARQGRTPVIRWDGDLNQSWPGTPVSS